MNDADRACRRLDPSVEGSARHGIAAPRGLGASPASRGGRFERLFPSLPPGDPGERALDVLVQRLERVSGNTETNSRIPAGYTYLAQFVDHDITFDPTSKLERDNDPLALVNFRTPRFDLDSLYGSGPADQPFLYDWRCTEHPGVKLLVQHNPHGHGLAPVDLPRNAEGRALIGDARNDENLIISQLHLLFIHFHNAVADRVHRKRPELTLNELFDQAQRIVRWHYQWIVAHDFLDRIVGRKLAADVRPDVTIGRGVSGWATRRRFYRWQEEPAIPVEFSGAAYRFGHSMVRHQYALRDDSEQPTPILPARGEECKPHLGGFRCLPEDLQIDWRRFFAQQNAPISSFRIDHCLSAPLFSLPPDGANLAQLNLRRGRALGLPSGSDVARAMGRPALRPDELLPPRNADVDFWPSDECPEERAAILRAPPLWFYVLRDAASYVPPEQLHPGGFRPTSLGPVGGRIVAEVLVGLLEGDPSSYLRQAPAWTPADEVNNLRLDPAQAAAEEAGRPDWPRQGIFTMRDLVGFTVPPLPPHRSRTSEK